tara:strand:- start:975 stop:2606 length:1632 start_codon:yes stop_codon:yes gene_type:complete
MKELFKNFNNLIKKTVFKVKNKTNNKLSPFKVPYKKNNKLLISNFNNLIQKIIFKVENKTNDKLLFFKANNKTKNKLLISNFNKYLITLISLLFFYLFYLSIPILYNKNWVQKNIENLLFKDFKIDFSLSSDISYRILPSPHYLVKDSKILKKNDKTVSLAEIKILKVFVNQKNFFDKEKMSLRNVKINNADFTLLANDLKLLKNSTNNKFSNKKIEINKSNIFYKNNLEEIVSIIKISEASLFQDDKDLLNLFNLKGETFNIPFNFNYKKKLNSLKSEEINIIAKRLKLNFFNIHGLVDNNENEGKNIISFLNSKIKTNYKIENDIMMFNSTNSKIKNSEIRYTGELSINPFDLNLDIELDTIDLHKMLDNNFILNELIKTELLFSDNISMSISLRINSDLKNKIFQDLRINYNIIDKKLNINETRLINKKIGELEIKNSNLSYENNQLILNTDIVVNIKDHDKLFSLLQTNKKFRRPITNILINLDYNYLSKEINFNNIKIDNKQISDELFRIIDDFNNVELNNFNKSKNLLNKFFENYEG